MDLEKYRSKNVIVPITVQNSSTLGLIYCLFCGKTCITPCLKKSSTSYFAKYFRAGL